MYMKSMTRHSMIHPILLIIVLVGFSIEANSKETHYFSQDTIHQEVVGRITDQQGEPLAGVTVRVSGTTVIAVSDENGDYRISVANRNSVLHFSTVGYESQELNVLDGGVLNVVLVSQVSDLDEVVVVGFGKQKRTDVVGSVVSVNPSTLKIPSSNLTNALAGRVAGMIAYQRSGEPGQNNADFFIRGVTTFGYKKDPLILIDNVESTSDDLARLQVDDIESFSILKDATATSLYGTRAANGVILIETKEGKEGSANITVRLENSVSMPTKDIELADPVTYMKLNNEAVKTRDPLSILSYSDERIENTELGINPYMYPAVDWKKELIKDYTTNQRINLNVRGGGKVASYYVAGAVNRDNGILKANENNNFDNNIRLTLYSLRSNVNVKLTKSTNLEIKLSGAFDDYTGPVSGGRQVYVDIMETPPSLFPPYFPKDSTSRYIQHIQYGNYDDGRSSSFFYNPYAALTSGYKTYSRSDMNAQLRIDQDLNFLTEGLNINVLLNTKRYAYFDVVRRSNPYYYQATAFDQTNNSLVLNLLNEESGTEYINYEPGAKLVRSSFYTQATLNYNRVFWQKHTINGLLVFTATNRQTGNPTDLQSSLPQRNVGFAGRSTYSYDNRYYGEFNFGYNASERFYTKFRWGFFPSFGVAWNVANESFWQPIKSTVSRLKIRATYGLTGNDEIGSPEDRFFYLSNIDMNNTTAGAVFGTENSYSRTGIRIMRSPNTSITWEEALKTNIGLELGLFNKLNIEADVFREVRRNILMSRLDIPASMGLWETPNANIGKTQGQGVDASLEYSQAFSGNLWVQARANFTYATSKYLIYEEPEYQDAYWKSRVGYSIGQRWGYIAERLFVDDREAKNSPYQHFGNYGGGDIKYHDINGDKQITTLDQVPIGYPVTPEIVYGFGFSMGYKNIDFSAFFQGLARESFFFDPAALAPFVSPDSRRERQLLNVIAEDYWSEDNRNLYAFWPRLSVTPDNGNNNNFVQSTWWLRNGAFLRLKQVEVGYTLPERLSNRLFMKSLRIYLNSMNPIIWSEFKLWDVEQGGNALNYPIQRTFNGGILASF